MTVNILQGSGTGRFYCIKCDGRRSQVLENRDEMFKHLELFHGWCREDVKPQMRFKKTDD
jgi:hypothetical protein